MPPNTVKPTHAYHGVRRTQTPKPSIMAEKRVFKIATDFGGIDVYEAFIRHGIVFVGCEKPEADADMHSIREGDVLIISSGFSVVAVGEALTPAADIHLFKRADDSLWASLDDHEVPILACKADLHKLERQDYLHYPKRGRVSKVADQKIIESALTLLDKYRTR